MVAYMHVEWVVNIGHHLHLSPFKAKNSHDLLPRDICYCRWYNESLKTHAIQQTTKPANYNIWT